jgi:hypothetical protein
LLVALLTVPVLNAQQDEVAGPVPDVAVDPVPEPINPAPLVETAPVPTTTPPVPEAAPSTEPDPEPQAGSPTGVEGIRRVGSTPRQRTNTGIEGVERLGPRGPMPSSRTARSRTIEIDGVEIRQVGIEPRPIPVPAVADTRLGLRPGVAVGPQGVSFDPVSGNLYTENAIFNVRSKRVIFYETQPNGIRVRKRVPHNPYSGAFNAYGVSYDPTSSIFRDRNQRLEFNVATGELMVYETTPLTGTYLPRTANLYRGAR